MDEPMIDENAIPPASMDDDDNNNGGANGDEAIMEDLIPAADFGDDVAKPETAGDDATSGGDDIAIPAASFATETNNNNNDNNEDDDAAVTTGNANDNDQNEDNDGAVFDQEAPAAYGSDDALMKNDVVSNMNVSMENGVQKTDNDNNNNDTQLEIGSAFDSTAQDDPLDQNFTGDVVQRNSRGQSVFNVEAIAMDESGKDTHGPIPNLIVELRFDLKLCFQGIEIDDSVVGPMIGLRPIIEQRIGQDFQELVRGIVNDDDTVLRLLTEYNDADQKFYNAAKYGSVGMLVLFLIFGIYAFFHLVFLNDTVSIWVLIGILVFVIAVAIGLLWYMLRSRKASKNKETEWRQAVLKSISSEMKNLWTVAANVNDDEIDFNSDLPIVFSLYYPLHSNTHDKEKEIQGSDQMVALRISQGPIIQLQKGHKNEPMYDTTADGM